MSPWIRVVQELGHWCAALPLLACFLLCLRKRDPSPDAWLLSGAFFISVIADSVAAITSAYGSYNWWLVYVYTPIQFGLFIALLATARAVRTVALLSLVLLSVVSVSRGTLGAPETVVQVLGGGLVGLLALEHTSMGKYKQALLLYCWATIPFLLVMGWYPPALEGPWIFAWAVYQGVRVTAMAFMVYALVQQPYLRLMEVSDGPRDVQAATGRRYPFGLSRTASVHAVAKEKRGQGNSATRRTG